MAERRMFARTIIDSDAFLEMPVSSRELYFQFGMRADDDGFINNPLSIMRLIQANLGDLENLINKKFILLTDISGIVLIKHWNINNYIQKDRYKQSKYSSLLKSFELDDNKAYRKLVDDLLDLAKNDLVYKMDTQASIGKASIGKASIGKSSGVKEDSTLIEEQAATAVNFQSIRELWNRITEVPTLDFITQTRKESVQTLVNQFGIKVFISMIQNVSESLFLRGLKKNGGGEPFRATFDWCIIEENFVKVIEGNYNNDPKTISKGNNKPDVEIDWLDEYLKSIE